MIRTQVYLDDEIHKSLMQLAQDKGTSFSHLVREGASEVIKKHYGEANPQKRALKFFAHPPKQYKVRLSKPSPILIRDERD